MMADENKNDTPVEATEAPAVEAPAAEAPAADAAAPEAPAQEAPAAEAAPEQRRGRGGSGHLSTRRPLGRRHRPGVLRGRRRDHRAGPSRPGSRAARTRAHVRRDPLPAHRTRLLEQGESDAVISALEEDVQVEISRLTEEVLALPLADPASTSAHVVRSPPRTGAPPPTDGEIEDLTYAQAVNRALEA